VEAYPEGAKLPDNYGKLALHYVSQVPFQRHFNAVSTLFQRCFNAISTSFQRHFNAISTPF